MNVLLFPYSMDAVEVWEILSLAAVTIYSGVITPRHDFRQVPCVRVCVCVVSVCVCVCVWCVCVCVCVCSKCVCVCVCSKCVFSKNLVMRGHNYLK